MLIHLDMTFSFVIWGFRIFFFTFSKACNANTTVVSSCRAEIEEIVRRPDFVDGPRSTFLWGHKFLAGLLEEVGISKVVQQREQTE